MDQKIKDLEANGNLSDGCAGKNSDTMPDPTILDSNGVPAAPPNPKFAKLNLQDLQNQKIKSVTFPVLGNQNLHKFPLNESVEILVRVLFEYFYGPENLQAVPDSIPQGLKSIKKPVEIKFDNLEGSTK